MLLIILLNVFDVPKEFCTSLNLIQISKSLELYFVTLLIGFISKHLKLQIIYDCMTVFDTLHQIIDNWAP